MNVHRCIPIAISNKVVDTGTERNLASNDEDTLAKVVTKLHCMAVAFMMNLLSILCKVNANKNKLLALL